MKKLWYVCLCILVLTVVGCDKKDEGKKEQTKVEVAKQKEKKQVDVFFEKQMPTLKKQYGEIEVVNKQEIKNGETTTYSISFIAKNVFQQPKGMMKKAEVTWLYDDKGNQLQNTAKEIK